MKSLARAIIGGSMPSLNSGHESWQGEQYGLATSSLGRLRLLIVGESHYLDKEDTASDSPQLTREIVERAKAGTREYQFYNRIADLVCNALDDPPVTKTEFWDAVAFRNLVATSVGTRDQRPTAEQWSVGAQTFFDELERLGPARVLVAGVETWNAIGTHFNSAWQSAAHPDWEEHQIRTWIPPSGGKLTATDMHHPSYQRGWRSDRWLPRVRLLLRA